jgi:hypothetical protein
VCNPRTTGHPAVGLKRRLLEPEPLEPLVLHRAVGRVHDLYLHSAACYPSLGARLVHLDRGDSSGPDRAEIHGRRVTFAVGRIDGNPGRQPI